MGGGLQYCRPLADRQRWQPGMTGCPPAGAPAHPYAPHFGCADSPHAGGSTAGNGRHIRLASLRPPLNTTRTSPGHSSTALCLETSTSGLDASFYGLHVPSN
eukprot:365091-Chlamydomonas_euryale.AAC.8